MVWVILFGVFLSFPSWAGQILTVGPGQTFQDIQSAINVANTNDIISVDPGPQNLPYFYSPFTITGGDFSIISTGGQSRPFHVRQWNGHPSITIQNTKAGDCVSVYFAQLDTDRSQRAIQIQNNAGAVRLNTVSVVANQDINNFPSGGVIDIRNSSSVWLYGLRAELQVKARYRKNVEHAGIFDGVSTLEIDKSNVLIQSSTILGTNSDGKYTRAGDAIRIKESQLRLTGYQGAVTVWGGQHLSGSYGGAGIRSMDTNFGASSASGCAEVLAWGGGTAVNQLWGGIYVHRFEPVFAYRNVGGFNRWTARALPTCIEPTKSAVGSIPHVLEGNHYGGTFLNATHANYSIMIGKTNFSPTFSGFGNISQSSAGGNWLSLPQKSVELLSGSTVGEVSEPFQFFIPESLSATGMQLTAQALSADLSGSLTSKPLVWSDPVMMLIVGNEPSSGTNSQTTK